MILIGGGLSYLKKYLLKEIDVENADSKDLKTLALCWAYWKRAFSVSGQFRKALTDLISHLHNSNKKLVKVTLSGEVLHEERFFLLGFVSIKIIELRKNIWFSILDSNQIGCLNAYLAECKRRWS